MRNKLVFTSSSVEVHCSREDTDTHELCSSFYPIHKNRINTLFKISLHKAPEVLQKFRGLTLDNLDAAPPKIQRIVDKELTRRRVMGTLLEYGATDDNGYVTDTLTLEKHQRLGREIAQTVDRFGFFYDTRTGKTPMSLAIIYDDIMKYPNHKWLVVCPLILIDNAWLPDADKFVPTLKVVSLHAATKAKRLKAFEEDAHIYVINTESFVSYREYIDKLNIYGCVVDESSTMKSPKSKQSKALCDFSETVKRWYLLTGTPAPNGEYEYYMQLKSIDKYCVPQSYSQFKEYFFINIAFNSAFEKLELRPDRKDELYELLRDYTLYVDKEDVLETPGRTFHEVEYELDEDAANHYRKMKNELYIELQDDTYITASAAGAKLNKLNQISSGFVFDTQAVAWNKLNEDKKQEIYELSFKRFDVLQDLLKGFGEEQVLIWANYRWEFDVLKRIYGDNCRCIYGGTTIEQKTEAIRLFKTGAIKYLCANPASADKGLTLTNAHIAVYFSLNWSYELYKQSMERIYGGIRIQPKHCDYYVILAKGTIDGLIYRDVLQGKADVSTAVLNHLKGGL